MMRRHLRKLVVNFSKLLTAFSFFRLRGLDLAYFQYVYPTIFAGVAVGGFYLLSDKYVVVKLDSFVASATTLMGVLIGFYIAALAAVTSFPNASLDDIMSGQPPRIKERPSGRLVSLTRRRFLSTLLGYCAFLSILIFVLGSASAAVDFKNCPAGTVETTTRYMPELIGAEAKLPECTPNALKSVLQKIWWGGFVWLLGSLLVVTMLCLHYLIDRMHRD